MQTIYTKPKLSNCHGILFLLLILVAVFKPGTTYATHAAGSDISYRCLGGNQYELTVSFYRDCGGVAEPDNISINCRSVNGSSNYNVTATKISGTGVEITLPCVTSSTNCNGGSGTGIREWKYRVTTTLPSAQTDWVFSYSVCCRNCAITTIQNPCASTSSLYVEARLNNLNGPCNSSPTFSNRPVANVCLAQNYTYNHGVIDVDGDSLSYSLVSPKISATTNVTFVSGLSATQPISTTGPFSLNSVTGALNFTASNIQIGILSILVREYRAGVLIGSVTRDMQVYVAPCTNNIPTLSGINGTASYATSTCVGQQVCFNINSADVDASQSVTIIPNISQVSMPGATHTISGGTRPTMQFCWTPTAADAGKVKTFTVTVEDNACPVKGSQIYTYTVNVMPWPELTTNNTLCNQTSGSVAVTPMAGFTTYLWNTGATTTSISGLASGTYTVTVNTTAGCSMTQSANVVYNGQLTLTGQNSSVCPGSCTGIITPVRTGGTLPITYAWSNGATTATLSNLCAGTYTVTATDANGCTAVATSTIASASTLTGTLTPTPVSCFGNNTGSMAVSMSGGTTPYTYAWSNGSTAATLSNVGAGTYTLTVTDISGCSWTGSSTITQPGAVLSGSLTPSAVLCNSGSSGSITSSINGGTTPYTYLWSNAQTTSGLSNLTTGTFTVTVTDANGCTLQLSASVNQPAVALSASGSGTDILCFGNSTGAINLTVVGGSGAFTFNWSNGATTEDISNLTAGSYTVTVADANGCSTTSSTTLIQPAAALGVTLNPTHILCYNELTGSVSTTVSGGTAPYTYLWSNNETTSSINGVGAGNFQVTVTDANNCTATANVTLTQPAAALSGSLTPSPVLCNAGNSGSITSSISGGTSPYTYLWSNSQTTSGINTLASGNYTVTVTDMNGCTLQLNTTVTQPAAAISATGSETNINCYGNSTGAVNLSVNGGTGAYTYNWSNGATTQDISNLTSGTYTVTVADANGCSTTYSTTLTQPSAALGVTLNPTNILCRDGLTGAISSTVSGGTMPYSYNWSNGATSAALSNIAAGTYTVTITDANNCTASASVTLSQPAAILSGTLNTTSILCNGGTTGGIISNISGGTSPYQYFWSNGQTTSGLSSISTGTYTLTVTDNHGCSIVLNSNVTEPGTSLSASGVPTDILCHGNSTGAINLSVSGGTPGYTYNWSNGATTQDLTNIPAGFYAVTVSDQNGCTVNYSTNLTEPVAPLSGNTSNTNILCHGNSTGVITANISGGTAPYNYLWSNSATSASISGIVAGSYTVTVTDAHNCTFTISTTLTQPAGPLSGTLTPSNISCHAGNDGSIVTNISGGTSPYQYSWSNGSSTPSQNGLTAGTYTVTVTDANGCTIQLNTTLTQPAASLAITHTQTNVLCHGNSTGAIDITVTGGTSPYTYLWNNNATSQDLTAITAGAYQVVVTDSKGCTETTSAIITEPATPLTTVTSCTAVKCHGASTGRALVTVSGGTGPYTYLWNTGSTLYHSSNVPAGNYTVTVTDANGCTSVNSTSVAQPAAPLTLTETHVNLSCFSQAAGSVNLSVTGGTTAYSYNWSNGFTTQDISGLSAGNYTVTVTDNNGCTACLTASITQPAGELNVTSALDHVNCFGGNDGEIALTLSMGTPPYSVLWSTGATSHTISNLSTGTYTASVSDANGCNLEITNIIQEPAGVLASTAVVIPVNCYGDATGSIQITATGGTTPYNYAWSNGATTANNTSLTAGMYTVTITDANGCTETSTHEVTQPSAALAIGATLTQPNCVNINNGIIDATITGGTAPYSILWSNGEISQDIDNLAPGTYTIIVTDAVNCTATADYTINYTAPQLTASGISTAVLCHGDSTGGIDLSVTGGTSPYTYVWNNGATSEDLIQAATGNYTVTITDINGCTETYTDLISEPAAALAATEQHVNVNCFGDATGQIQLNVTGGTPSYTYLWSDGNTGEDRVNLTSGAYSVTITDANGCTSTISVNITQPAAALNAQGSITDILCYGNNTGSVMLTATGGTTPYSYVWSNGDTTASVQNVTSGTYQVLITDANGCTFQASHTLTQPTAAITIASTSQNVACTGNTTGSITLTASGGTPNYSYVWSTGATTPTVNNLAAGSYSVTVTDANGCTDLSSINVQQPALGVAVNGNVTDATCILGMLGNISITPTGGTTPYSFVWSNGSTSQNLNNVLPGTYHVTVTDANGCSAGKEFLVADLSTLNVQANGTATICVGNMVDLAAQFSQPIVAALQWYFNGNPLIGATTTTFSTPVAGSYTLVASTACGSYTSNAIEVVVRSLNSVYISSEAIICPGETVRLQAGGGVDYNWSPTKGLSDSTTASPLASPTETTEYTVTVTDNFGCSARASVIINVMCDTLDIPNGFSPNDDGTNDTFVIDGLSKYPVNTLWIYNRWGSLVYKQNNYDNTWDGRSNVNGAILGQNLPNGTYYYMLDLKLDQKPFKGFVVIRR